MLGIRSAFRVAVLCVLLCVCTAASAQVVINGDPVPGEVINTSQPQKPSDKKYFLSGTVVNSVTGEVIPRALVSINQIAMLTDASGNFRFEGLPQGMYSAQAQKPGFFDPQMASHRQAPTQFEAGPDSDPITLKLLPEAVIFGRVIDSDGLPVYRLPIQCEKLMYVEGRKQWQTTGSKFTDEDGYYRIPNLTPGTYLVMTGPSLTPSLDAMVKTARQMAGYGIVYYSPPSEGSATDGLRITAGQRFEADFSVEAQPFYSVTGTIIGAPPGTPNTFVNLRPRGQHHQRFGLSGGQNANGIFHIPMVAAGDYVVEARAQGPVQPGSQEPPRQWSARLPLHLGSDVTGLQVALEPLVAIPINRQVEHSASAPASNQSIISAGGGFAGLEQLKLRSVDDPEHVEMARYQQINDKPVHQFSDVEPGAYTLEFEPSGDQYVASAHYGSTDLLREDLIVGQSANQNTIDIVMRDDGGKVKGTLTDGGRGAGGLVLVVPDHGTPYPARTYVTAENPNFTISGLAPGAYTILAFDSLDFEYTNHDVLEPYLEKGAHADVTANQESSVSLELIKLGED